MQAFESEDFYLIDDPERKGLGLFAKRSFAPGESLYPFDYWSQKFMPIHATNHSCEPNAGFNAAGLLVALREIAKDEEITFDYRAHRIPASPWNFKCLCGTPSCAGWISISPTSPDSEE